MGLRADDHEEGPQLSNSTSYDVTQEMETVVAERAVAVRIYFFRDFVSAFVVFNCLCNIGSGEIFCHLSVGTCHA